MLLVCSIAFIANGHLVYAMHLRDEVRFGVANKSKKTIKHGHVVACFNCLETPGKCRGKEKMHKQAKLPVQHRRRASNFCIGHVPTDCIPKTVQM